MTPEEMSALEELIAGNTPDVDVPAALADEVEGKLRMAGVDTGDGPVSNPLIDREVEEGLKGIFAPMAEEAQPATNPLIDREVEEGLKGIFAPMTEEAGPGSRGVDPRVEQHVRRKTSPEDDTMGILGEQLGVSPEEAAKIAKSGMDGNTNPLLVPQDAEPSMVRTGDPMPANNNEQEFINVLAEQLGVSPEEAAKIARSGMEGNTNPLLVPPADGGGAAPTNPAAPAAGPTPPPPAQGAAPQPVGAPQTPGVGEMPAATEYMDQGRAEAERRRNQALAASNLANIGIGFAAINNPAVARAQQASMEGQRAYANSITEDFDTKLSQARSERNDKREDTFRQRQDNRAEEGLDLRKMSEQRAERADARAATSAKLDNDLTSLKLETLTDDVALEKKYREESQDPQSQASEIARQTAASLVGPRVAKQLGLDNMSAEQIDRQMANFKVLNQDYKQRRLAARRAAGARARQQAMQQRVALLIEDGMDPQRALLTAQDDKLFQHHMKQPSAVKATWRPGEEFYLSKDDVGAAKQLASKGKADMEVYALAAEAGKLYDKMGPERIEELGRKLMQKNSLGRFSVDINDPEYAEYQQIVDTLRNSLLKSRSGAAVSEGEFKRFQDEMGAGLLRDPKMVRKWIDRVKDLSDKAIGMQATPMSDIAVAAVSDRFATSGGNVPPSLSNRAARAGWIPPSQRVKIRDKQTGEEHVVTKETIKGMKKEQVAKFGSRYEVIQ